MGPKPVYLFFFERVEKDKGGLPGPQKAVKERSKAYEKSPKSHYVTYFWDPGRSKQLKLGRNLTSSTQAMACEPPK